MTTIPVHGVRCPECGKEHCYDISSDFLEFCNSTTEFRHDEWECRDCGHTFKTMSTYKLSYYSLIDPDTGEEGDEDFELVPEVSAATKSLIEPTN